MNISELTKKEQIKLAMEWFDEEGISHYSDEYVDKDEGSLYITIGEYDYEISQAEIEYRAELILENREEEESEEEEEMAT